MKWTFDPREISTKLRFSDKLEDMYPDQQTYYQTITIGTATSINGVPRLVHDISNYYDSFSNDKNIKRVDIYKQFYSDLFSLSDVINERNSKRITPFHCANPINLETTFSQ
jgi:hypothetical protein